MLTTFMNCILFAFRVRIAFPIRSLFLYLFCVFGRDMSDVGLAIVWVLTSVMSLVLSVGESYARREIWSHRHGIRVHFFVARWDVKRGTSGRRLASQFGLLCEQAVRLAIWLPLGAIGQGVSPETDTLSVDCRVRNLRVASATSTYGSSVSENLRGRGFLMPFDDFPLISSFLVICVHMCYRRGLKVAVKGSNYEVPLRRLGGGCEAKYEVPLVPTRISCCKSAAYRCHGRYQFVYVKRL